MAGGSSARAEMRPSATTKARCVARFLRSRGDAPHSRWLRFSNARVPPLARRCARGHLGDQMSLLGSSARAEMRRKLAR